MKIKITHNLCLPEDKMTLFHIANATETVCAINKFGGILSNTIKHNNYSEETQNALEAIQSSFYENLAGYLE